MRILHTSDWHIGRGLYRRSRYEEIEQFLRWLLQTLEEEHISALIIAGDIFDTSTPSVRAQELYYSFLCQVAALSCCRHIVVIAGNHDSPSFLNAPREILRNLQIHVVGVAEEVEKETLILRNSAGVPELIVCAVPYLRERDIRTVEMGESIDDKLHKLVEGTRKHYARAAAYATLLTERYGKHIPLVATGHLFAAGGSVVEGDGVRELYVGTLAHIDADIFPADFDYIALGHLHSAQKVGGRAHIRYSGSPLPMSFSEAGITKKVLLVDLASDSFPLVQEKDIPLFRYLEQVKGSWKTIESRIMQLKQEDCHGWLEVTLEGTEVIPQLRLLLEELIKGSGLEILRVRNNAVVQTALGSLHEGDVLKDMTPEDVFERCLDSYNVPDEQRAELRTTYQDVLCRIQEDG